MARLHVTDPQQTPEGVRTILEKVEKKVGFVPNLTRVLANSPATLEGYIGLSRALSGSALGLKLREQIALVVAETNGCDYCLASHSAFARMAGLSEEAIRASREAASECPKVNTALKFARAIVAQRGRVTDEQLAAVREAGFSDAEITEILATVVLNIFTNYVNHVAQVELDFPGVAPLSPVVK